MLKFFQNTEYFFLKTFIFFIIFAHFIYVIYDYNISVFVDYYILLILLFNFKLKQKSLILFTILFLFILFNLFRVLFSNQYLDLTYLFISLKLLVFALFFIAYKPINNNKSFLYVNLVKILFFTCIILITSDKLFALFNKGFINGLLYRPRLIGEINFDIVLLLELWLILKLFSPTYKNFYGLLLLVVVLISLSRSGIIAYALMNLFLFIGILGIP